MKSFKSIAGHVLRIPSKDDFMALQDVSFSLNQGEVLGVIGRNGSGKSTLLKILSNITKPTNGSFDVNGKLGGLIELGAGFHPDLTGEENIYLYGSILGMSRKEIKKKFSDAPQLIDMTIRIERRNGHEFIPELVRAFPGLIDSVTLSKPTLEDVFIHKTGHKFWNGQENLT